jgi:hypothetical protein
MVKWTAFLIHIWQLMGTNFSLETGYPDLVMEAIRTPETSVNFYKPTQCKIPEDCHLHTYAT